MQLPLLIGALRFHSLLTIVVCVSAVSISAQDVEKSERIDIEIASEEVRRYALLMTSAGQAANRGVDLALDRIFGEPSGMSAGARTRRILRLYFVSLPIAAGSHFGAHEMGHLSRAHENGAELSAVSVRRWPWPVPFMTGSLHLTKSSDELRVIVGGSDGARIQEAALLDQIYLRPEANYFDWILLLYAKLDLPLYTWASELNTGQPRRFDDTTGDPEAFAREFGLIRAALKFRPTDGSPVIVPEAEQAAEIADAGRLLHRRMYLNLADYSLLAAFTRAFQYLSTGERSAPPPALELGHLRLVPAARFFITPLGPETTLEVRAMNGRGLQMATTTVRVIETASGRRLWAGGLRIRSRMRSGTTLALSSDVFQRTADRAGLEAQDVGLRLEVGLERGLRLFGNSMDLGGRLGYKSSGYLMDCPNRATLLGGLSLSFRF